MTLYMHRTTIERRFNGEPFERETGLAWSETGKQDDLIGFERGDFTLLVLLKKQLAAERLDTSELLIGMPYHIVSDCELLNDH